MGDEIVDGTGEPLGFEDQLDRVRLVKVLRAHKIDESTPWLAASGELSCM